MYAQRSDADWSLIRGEFRAWFSNQWADAVLLATDPIDMMRIARRATPDELALWAGAIDRCILRGEVAIGDAATVEAYVYVNRLHKEQTRIGA